MKKLQDDDHERAGVKRILSVLCMAVMLAGCSAQDADTESAAGQQEVLETLENAGVKQTYRVVLEDIYYEQKFPPYERSIENYDFDITENEFAIYDIDHDGREELVFLLTQSYTATMFASVYDCDSEGNIVEQFHGFPRLTFYSNGMIEVGISHNQGHSGRFWPYTMYQYDAETDSYNAVAYVEAVDKDVIDTINSQLTEAGEEPAWDYPEEADISGSGLVYYICPHGIESDAEPADVTEYNIWHDTYVGDAEILDLPFMKLTEENINKVFGK
ncbi:MAG: hypothetical protein IJ496_07665 [Ruminococcus sp.]|nr:hypothetical protein [Ruminococcus sp.]